VTNRQPAVYPAATMTRLKVRALPPGGGITGAMYQIGALWRWKTPSKESEFRGFELYRWHSSAATWRPLWPRRASGDRLYPRAARSATTTSARAVCTSPR